MIGETAFENLAIQCAVIVVVLYVFFRALYCSVAVLLLRSVIIDSADGSQIKSRSDLSFIGNCPRVSSLLLCRQVQTPLQ